MSKPKIGQPAFRRGDVVLFHCPQCVDWDGNLVHEAMDIEGVIEIVDAYGTSEQNEEPSYDIYVKTSNVLHKHVVESRVMKKIPRYCAECEHERPVYKNGYLIDTICPLTNDKTSDNRWAHKLIGCPLQSTNRRRENE